MNLPNNFFMEAPTLSKKKKLKTLSAKKSKGKETIKNVVATPYDNSYWPLISPIDHSCLKKILENNLPKIKNEKIKISWGELKDIPKSERKKFREEYIKNHHHDYSEIDKDASKGIFMGVNSVTKLLESNLASAVLIASDVQPKIMVQHVVDQAVLYGVSIIIFQDLRTLLRRICGISSIVLGISKNINSESKLNLVGDAIEQIFQKCPKPVNHINYNRSLKDEIVIVEKENKEDEPKPTEKKINEVEIDQSLYLKRNSKDRVFIPKLKDECIKSGSSQLTPLMEVDSSGFLPFSLEPAPKVETESVKLRYKSLVVKRLKGDPNRSKKKIESLKRRKK